MNISTPQAKPNTSKVGAWIVLIIFGLIVFGIIAGASSNKDDSTADSAETSVADNSALDAQTRQSTIDRFAPLYCEKRQGTKVTLNESGIAEGWPSNDGSGWSSEECVTIISKLYDSGAKEEELAVVTNNQYAIGMLEMSLLYSLGSPSDINRTRFSGYSSSQYVYGTTYIYTENGKVTSFQD